MTTIDAVPVVLGNILGAMPRDLGRVSDRCLATLEHRLRRAGGGIGIVVEADDAAIKKVLDPDIYWTRHRQAEDLDGVLIFGTRQRCGPAREAWKPGAPASRVNADRPILTVEVEVDGGEWSLDVAGFHRPKRGGERAADLMDDRVNAARPDLFGCDGNLRAEAMRRRYSRGYTLRSREVMHFGARRTTTTLGRLDTFDIGVPDALAAERHPGMATTVRPARRQEHR